MSDPKTIEEYNRLQQAGQKIAGFGFENIEIESPCPGCCAPGFHKYKLMNVKSDGLAGGTCKVCGRGFKGILHHDDEHSTAFEFVQTAGPDLPPYLPKIRRVEEVELPDSKPTAPGR
jgi:hypothetical protein